MKIPIHWQRLGRGFYYDPLHHRAHCVTEETLAWLGLEPTPANRALVRQAFVRFLLARKGLGRVVPAPPLEGHRPQD